MKLDELKNNLQSTISVFETVGDIYLNKIKEKPLCL